MKLKSTILSILFCSISFFTYAQTATPTKEYIDEFKKFSELSGAVVAYDAIVDQLATMALSGESPEKIAEIKEAIRPKVIDLISETMAPIYMESGITIEDIKKMSEFYASPVGKKIGLAQKDIMNKSAQKGQQLVMEIQSLLQNATK